jgi:hypothetical protein
VKERREREKEKRKFRRKNNNIVCKIDFNFNGQQAGVALKLIDFYLR